jgi:hypothetical protein
MSEHDMAVLVQTLLHYLKSADVPSLDDIVAHIESVQTRHPGYDEGTIPA